MKELIRVCKKCVMDSTDPEIIFDEYGICNHCKKAEELINKIQIDSNKKNELLESIVNNIKKKSKGKKYDCIIGVSGGVDSTYVAYLVKKLGLKPLAVHMDNGWDSELSVSNIEKTMNKLNIDLYTYVLDWEEFKELQIAFLKASVPHCEHPTDHAITAVLYQVANKLGIKYIILGSNVSTESIGVKSWSGGQRDWKYIKSIHKKFSPIKLKHYPHISGFKFFYYMYIRKIKTISILNYVDYIKEDVLSVLESELGWKYYGGKHYESIYTKFFQTYILPIKFNIDKRKIHLSPLICSGQITRDEALKELQNEIYPKNKIEEDKQYVLKKLGLDEKEFDYIMQSPVKLFRNYPSYENSWIFKVFYPLLRRKGDI